MITTSKLTKLIESTYKNPSGIDKYIQVKRIFVIVLIK